MSRAALTCAIVLAACAALGACGGDGGQEASIPPARPVDASGCSPVTYGGDGRPDFLIAASTLLQGQFREHGVQASQALKLVLAQHGWRAGDFRVGAQICDEVAPSGDLPSPRKCRHIARALARSHSVLVLEGPYFSSCAREMLPILNRAPGGPLPAVSESATYVGLTRSGAGVERGDPERNFPTGRRSFARVVPTDDVQGAAGAVFAKDKGARRPFVLDNGDAYGAGVAAAFRVAAGRTGLDVAGTARWDPNARDYLALASRIRRAGADAVYLGGYVSDNGPRLIKDLRETLGPAAQIIGPDGFNQPAPIVEGAGRAAEGFAPTIPVLPNDQLPSEGREFAEEFEKRFGARPCCYAVHAAQAAEMILDAISNSDGTRAKVLENLFAADVKDGLIGDFEIDRRGDTTSTTIGVYRIDGGRLLFDTAISPPADLLARE